MLDDNRIAHGQDDAIAVEPFEVLNRLARVLMQILRHVDFHGMPTLQVSHCGLRQRDRTELVVAAGDPQRLGNMISLAVVENWLIVVLDVVASDLGVRACCEHLVRHSGVPIEVGQLAVGLVQSCERVFRLRVDSKIPDFDLTLGIADRKLVFIVRVESHVLYFDSLVWKLGLGVRLDIPEDDFLVE